jgi:hypothetical protein
MANDNGSATQSVISGLVTASLNAIVLFLVCGGVLVASDNGLGPFLPEDAGNLLLRIWLAVVVAAVMIYLLLAESQSEPVVMLVPTIAGCAGIVVFALTGEVLAYLVTGAVFGVLVLLIVLDDSGFNTGNSSVFFLAPSLVWSAFTFFYYVSTHLGFAPSGGTFYLLDIIWWRGVLGAVSLFALVMLGIRKALEKKFPRFRSLRLPPSPEVGAGYFSPLVLPFKFAAWMITVAVVVLIDLLVRLLVLVGLFFGRLAQGIMDVLVEVIGDLNIWVTLVRIATTSLIIGAAFAGVWWLAPLIRDLASTGSDVWALDAWYDLGFALLLFLAYLVALLIAAIAACGRGSIEELIRRAALAGSTALIISYFSLLPLVALSWLGFIQLKAVDPVGPFVLVVTVVLALHAVVVGVRLPFERREEDTPGSGSANRRWGRS